MPHTLLTTMIFATALTLGATAHADYLSADSNGDLYNIHTGDYYFFDGQGYVGPDGYYNLDGDDIYGPNGEYYWATGDGDFQSFD